MNWLLGRLKWILAAAAIGGPIAGYIGFSEGAKLAKLETEGTQAQAYITEAYAKSKRRRGTTFTVGLEWQDASGAKRSASDVTIDGDYARTIISDDTLTADFVPIYYMENDRDVTPVVVGSLEGEKETSNFMKFGGIGGGILGILGSVFMFMTGRKKG